jgi:large subunit ribosomal protein L17
MRHGKKHNHLGRTTSHRHAMLKNMASSLILHKRIETTLAKAKELRKYIDPLLTRSKEDTTHNRRIIFSYLSDKEIVKELFSTVSDKIADRPGGYTRIIKLGQRQGDAAEMCMVELVDFNETTLALAADKSTKTRRSRRGGKKADTDTSATTTSKFVEEPAVVETVAEVIEDEPAVEAVAEVVDETPAVEESAVVETVAEVEPDVVNVEADDLKIVEGIGPKIAEAFADAGVTTFAQVAEMSPEAMNEIITGAGISSKNTETWAKQAEMARDGKMDELKVWQDELNGGRE